MAKVVRDYYTNSYPVELICNLIRLMMPLDDDSNRMVMLRSSSRTIRQLPLCDFAREIGRICPDDGVHFEVTDRCCCLLLDVDYQDGETLPAPRRDGICECKTAERQLCHRCWPILALNAALIHHVLIQFFGFAAALCYTSGRRGYHAMFFPPTGSPLPCGRAELCHRLWHLPRQSLLKLCKTAASNPHSALEPLSASIGSLQTQPWVLHAYQNVVLPRFRAEWLPVLFPCNMPLCDAVNELRNRTIAHNAHENEKSTHCLDCRINAAVISIRRAYTMHANQTNGDWNIPAHERWDVFLVLMRLCLLEVDETASVSGHAFRLPLSTHGAMAEGRYVATPFDVIESLNVMPVFRLGVEAPPREFMHRLKHTIKRGCDYDQIRK